MSYNQNNRNQSYLENTDDNCVDFDYDYDILNKTAINPKDFTDSLIAIDRYIKRKAISLAVFIGSLNDEERISFLSKAQGMSYRKIGQLLGIDKNTAQDRYYSAKHKIDQFTKSS
jgi:DNA-directed RNA polymerase specialized sigma24 family protein